MPPKAKRYRVWVKDPILNTWRVIATEQTVKDAEFIIGRLQWDAKKELID
jgi:hypothetical protein